MPFKVLHSILSARPDVHIPWSRISSYILRSSPSLFVRTASTTSQISTDTQANTQTPVINDALFNTSPVEPTTPALTDSAAASKEDALPETQNQSSTESLVPTLEFTTLPPFSPVGEYRKECEQKSAEGEDGIGKGEYKIEREKVRNKIAAWRVAAVTAREKALGDFIVKKALGKNEHYEDFTAQVNKSFKAGNDSVQARYSALREKLMAKIVAKKRVNLTDNSEEKPSGNVRIVFGKEDDEENGIGINANPKRDGDETGLRNDDVDVGHDAHAGAAAECLERLGNMVVVKKHFTKPRDPAFSVRKFLSNYNPHKIQGNKISRVSSEASSSPEGPTIRKVHLTYPLPTTPTGLQTPKILPHLTSDGSAHMVSVTSKDSTHRVAVAVGTVFFSVPDTYRLISENLVQKGDVLGIARVAGIMAAKNCPALVPLCHPIALSGVAVDVKLLPPNETDAETYRAAPPRMVNGWERIDITQRLDDLKSKQDEITDSLERIMGKLVKMAARAQGRLHNNRVNKKVNQEEDKEQVFFSMGLKEMMEKGAEAIASLKDAQNRFWNTLIYSKQTVKACGSESDATSSQVFSEQDRERARSLKSHGCVRIEAKVECVGPTGVEMEALTSVSAAALTVIDMVKAVDRNARIDGVKMVMKKGGRSGLHVDQLWAQDPNRVYDMD